MHCGQCIISYNALAVVSTAVLYMNYSTRSAFELPMQSGTYNLYIYIYMLLFHLLN